MNQEQRRYAKTRIDEIYKEKQQGITELCKLTPVYLSNADKIKAIKNGEYTIKAHARNPDGWNSNYWADAFIFTKEKLANQDTARYNALLNDLKAQKAKVLDELYLGDETKALEAIQAFAKFDVK